MTAVRRGMSESDWVPSPAPHANDYREFATFIRAKLEWLIDKDLAYPSFGEFSDWIADWCDEWQGDADDHA